MTLKVGIAGIGAIGGSVARALDAGDIPGFALGGIAARDPDRIAALSAELSAPPRVLDFYGLARHCDWVVEALPPALFDDLARPVLSDGKTLVVLSTSQLLGRDDLVALARERGGRIVVPSGAMLGLDALKAVSIAKVESVVIETRKPIEGLIKSDYVIRTGMDLRGVTEATCILAGTVTEVAREFPANVNVAASLSLAGIGPDRTRMEIWVDPTATRNKHVVRVRSDSSDFTMSIENRPSGVNPATGRITPQSVIALLRHQSAPLRIGT